MQRQPLLSPEDLASHVQTCQVIFAMWSGADELIIDQEGQEAVEKMTQYLALPIQELGSPKSVEVRDSLPASIAFTLVTRPFVGTSSQSGSSDRKLLIDVELPLRKIKDSASGSLPLLSLRRSDWLTRANQEEVSQRAKLDQLGKAGEEDGGTVVMDAVEALTEAVVDMDEAGQLSVASQGALQAENSTNAPDGSNSSSELSSHVLRTWHHLPSLSTKAKRDDLVSYAASTLHNAGLASSSSSHRLQPLTGFVIAGKPGLVVLECPLPPLPKDDEDDGSKSPSRSDILLSATQVLDTYWGEIKSRSWADIPAGHKKVSERLREEYVERCWWDMQEMTGAEEIGGRAAMRDGWRNDLGKIEGWLKDKGAGGRIRDVLGADW